ncbi:rhomboid family intramembrane serine protease GlpG [Parasalinivibrio latis]|uniref:rhomboid family intramembrane serine protease GlpG n=1 Tax=Parasalinivibrio latis TaxID=2952610 RepID=UPI0030E12A57
MQRLAAINNPRAAQAFIDYMKTRHISVEMMPEEGGRVALWLRDDQDLVEAQAELDRFIQNPNDPRYMEASWSSGDTRSAKFVYPANNLMGLVKAKAGPLTLFVMAACAVIYVLGYLGLGGPIFSLLHFPANPAEDWQLWRLFSHAFLHFSPLHIIFNLLWWWTLGGEIERKLGTNKLLQIFLLSSLFSGFAQYFFSGANFGGLSGVVYALLGYLWFIAWLAPQKGLGIDKGLVGFMLFWLVFGFVEPFGMNIANMAHLAGLLSGCGIAVWDAKRQR